MLNSMFFMCNLMFSLCYASNEDHDGDSYMRSFAKFLIVDEGMDFEPTALENSIGNLSTRFLDETISFELMSILDAVAICDKKVRRSLSLIRSSDVCSKLLCIIAIATFEGF